MTLASSLSADIGAVLLDLPLFTQATDRGLVDLASSGEERLYRTGQFIFHRGESAQELYVLIRGRIKIRNNLPDDREVTSSWIADVDYFGMRSVIDGEPHATDAVAVEDSKVLVLPKEPFLTFLWSEPAVMKALIQIMALKYRSALQKYQDQAVLDVPGRLARAMLRICDEASLEVPGRLAKALTEERQILSDNSICISASQQDLASLIGATRESTNKWLRYFAHEGWISLARGEIRIIQPQALRSQFLDRRQ